MRVMVLSLLLLCACGRPLTTAEAALAHGMFGDSLDASQVRMVENGLVGVVSRSYPARPRTTCRERILPPDDSPVMTSRTAGMVLWEQVHLRPDIFFDDYARTPGGGMSLGAAMFLVHELTHVWQWQNRQLTGYSPMRGGAEHRPGVDPYLFDPAAGSRFLDFGYEQQASLVEEYLCCQALDPEGARTARLHALLSQVMEPPRLSLPAEIVLPWAEAPVRGICG